MDKGNGGAEMTQLTLSFIMTSFTMSLIILVVFAIGALFPKVFAAKFRYMVWLIVLIGLIIPIRPLIGTGLIGIPIPVETQTVNENFGLSGGHQIIADTALSGVEIDNIEQGFYNQTVLPQAFDAHPLVDVLFLLWIIPAIVIFGYHLWKYAKFNRLVNRWGKAIADDETIDLFENIKDEMKIRRNIELRKCSFVSTSMLIGFWRPMILLPEKNFDAEELSLIFLHELTHYKRGDLFIKLASVVVLSVHWFNPAVYLMSAAMQTDSEASCDETVLQGVDIDNRRFYAELIMEMIGDRKSQGTLLSTCFFASGRGIKIRMRSILDAKKTIRGFAVTKFVTLIFMVMLSGSVFAITPILPDATAVLPTDQSIGLSQAREIALSVAPGGTLQRIDAGYVNGGLILGVVVSHQDRTYRMVLDASNGAIMHLHTQSPHETNGISLSQAIQIAHNDLIERGISALFRASSGIDWEYMHWVWELEFDSDLGDIEYYIDINSGRIVNFVVHDR
jgi:beta-lactamase regulating signal transducer with metallopeptidase domain